jgi:hypothetical protein
MMSFLDEIWDPEIERIPGALTEKALAWSGKKKDKSLDDDVTLIVIEVGSG